MISYNVTVIIDFDIENEWVKWMKKKHIPDVINTGIFESYVFYKILKSESSGNKDKKGAKYLIQYFCKDMDKLNEYFERYAKKLQKEHSTRYKDKFVAFRSIMKKI